MDSRRLLAHETERIQLFREGAQDFEGLVVIEPVEDGNEFTSVLTIRDLISGRDPDEANRFVPFIRIVRPDDSSKKARS